MPTTEQPEIIHCVCTVCVLNWLSTLHYKFLHAFDFSCYVFFKFYNLVPVLFIQKMSLVLPSYPPLRFFNIYNALYILEDSCSMI